MSSCVVGTAFGIMVHMDNKELKGNVKRLGTLIYYAAIGAILFAAAGIVVAGNVFGKGLLELFIILPLSTLLGGAAGTWYWHHLDKLNAVEED